MNISIKIQIQIPYLVNYKVSFDFNNIVLSVRKMSFTGYFLMFTHINFVVLLPFRLNLTYLVIWLPFNVLYL